MTWSYLQGAYRDPHAGRAALDELVKSQGWTSAAVRFAADPFQLRELRGKNGLFAGAKAREAESRTERTYCTGVEAQRTADATGIPLVARPRRVQTTNSQHAFPVAPNLLNRQFTASRPNQVWLVDLTSIAISEGWLYLAAIMDLHTRRIVGWSMHNHLAPSWPRRR